MYKVLFLAFALTAVSCKNIYSTRDGAISKSGEILDQEVLSYALKAQGTYSGQHFDALRTFKKKKFVSKYDSYPASLTFALDGNVPKLQINLNANSVCKYKFGKLEEIHVNKHEVSSWIRFSSNCDSKERLAVVYLHENGTLRIFNYAGGKKRWSIFKGNKN